MTGQELAVRTGIPPALAAAGVQVVERDGVRIVEIPDTVRKTCNVLLPISEVTQADPNWTPSFRAVTLDPERHAYHDSNSRQNELSLRKTGLLSLASVAGITVRSTCRLPVAQLREHEIGWQATVAVRRSDGTWQEMTASRVVNMDVERERLMMEVRSSQRYRNDQERRAAFERRWLYEREHADSKCETKAIERAIRAALQLPHAFSAAELARPFLVVGYSFTPDASDPEVRRLVVEAGLAASQRMYAQAALPAGEPAPPAEAVAATDVVEPEPAEAGEVPADDRGPEPDDGPAFDGDEPTGFQPPPGAPADAGRGATAAGLTTVGFGKHNGRTIQEIGDTDPGYVAWLADVMAPRNDVGRAVQAAARVWARAYLAGAEQ